MGGRDGLHLSSSSLASSSACRGMSEVGDKQITITATNNNNNNNKYETSLRFVSDILSQTKKIFSRIFKYMTIQHLLRRRGDG